MIPHRPYPSVVSGLPVELHLTTTQDPEKCKLGQRGIWLTKAQRAKKEKAEAEAEVCGLTMARKDPQR